MAYLVWGDRKILICQNRGDRKIPGPLNRGDHKISRVNIAQFFSPPPPVVNVSSLISLEGHSPVMDRLIVERSSPIKNLCSTGLLI